MKVELLGDARPDVTAKDIALHIIGSGGADGGQYRAMEFSGDAIANLSLDERAVIPNMMAEFGAQSAYIQPDEAIFSYLESRRKRDFTALFPDPDASYAATLDVDVRNLEPLVAMPHSPDNTAPLCDALGEDVQQAFIGTCTNGRYGRSGRRRACTQGPESAHPANCHPCQFRCSA